MKVISINDKSVAKRKADLLETIDYIRKAIESGEIEEFVAVSMNEQGETQIHACVNDFVGGVGLFEIGKHILISQEA
jgi:hypothetical protein